MTDTNLPASLTEMMRVLEDKMMDCLLVFEKKYGKPMPIPTIIIKPRIGLKLGYAEQNNTITLNRDLCDAEHWPIILNETLPHEVAHLVAPQIYSYWRHGQDRHSGWGHGRAWKECMITLGLPPDRCHGPDTRLSEKIRVRGGREKNFAYSCGCKDRLHYVSITIHNKIRNGQTRRCNYCKVRVTFHGEKIEKLAA